MADAIAVGIPLIVGLVGVLFAILDRGYGRYLEEKKTNPDLKFGSMYLLNLLVSTGIGAVVVTVVLPAVVSAIGESENPAITVVVVVTNFVLGYSTTYTALSKMNTSTERKLEVAKTEHNQ